MDHKKTQMRYKPQIRTMMSTSKWRSMIIVT